MYEVQADVTRCSTAGCEELGQNRSALSWLRRGEEGVLGASYPVAK